MPSVLLINPPTTRNQFIGFDNYFPMGLMSMGTVLKKNNINVEILDINNIFYEKELDDNIFADYIENELYSYIKDFRPDIIGIGGIFSGVFINLRTIAKFIKEKFPNIPIVCGGVHPTIFGSEILANYSYVDFVVTGEGEISILELVESLYNGSGKALDAIGGLVFRKNGSIHVNPKKYLDNIDELPFIDYDLIDVKTYHMDTSHWYSPLGIEVGQPYTIISSRSCPLKCTFCSMPLIHGPVFRAHSPTRILDEMEHLYDKYNVRYFQFYDDNMTYDRERAIEIMLGIRKRKMKIQFGTPSGLSMNRLHAELIDHMIEAGWVTTSIAIESGSDYIRNKVMKKGLMRHRIYEIMDALTKHDHLFIKGFFIIGMPEETHETLEETYQMLKELPLDKFDCSFAAPYPGTKLFDQCIRDKLLPYKAEHYVDVENLQGKVGKPHFKPYNLTEEDLIEFQKKAFDLWRAKRLASKVPDNYPLRYKGEIKSVEEHHSLYLEYAIRDKKATAKPLYKLRTAI